MASDTAYIELRSTRRVRKILATAADLVWTFGRRTAVTVLYQSAVTNTATVTKKIDTLIQDVEVTPNTPPAAGAGTALNPNAATHTVSAFAVIAPDNSTIDVVPVLDANMEILDVSVLDYVRFTGTGLPATGLMFDMADVAGIYNVAPTAGDSL